MKRILDLNRSDLKNMNKNDKLTSIKLSEGRTLISEVICTAPAALVDVSNIEVASAFGADLILLNTYNVDRPFIYGLAEDSSLTVIEQVKRLTGKMVGVNLEPVDLDAEDVITRQDIDKGRWASLENIEKLVDQGADMVVLTGNPETGVTNKKLIEILEKATKRFGDKLIFVAGKMHSSGSISEMGRNLINKNNIEDFISAGADIVLLPAPGTIPGFSLEYVAGLIEFIQAKGRMALTAIGTSQEGADIETIRQIALYSKMAGTDLHHIGDCGYPVGMASPENIMAYSIAIKGKRHTFRSMSRSVNR